MKKLALSAFLVLIALSGFSQTQADKDAPKRDVFVILDVSGSMTQQSRFTNVQDYLDREVVNGLLKNGDNFTLVTFGDSANEQFTRAINSDSDKSNLISDLRKIKPDNDYTDIGMAMEKLAEILEKREESGVRRVILFITDGLNAPPRGSKYRGADLAVDERFKELGEKISRGSWFLYVIGIGGLTDAQSIANAIPGSVLQTTDANLGGVDINAQVNQLEEKEQAIAAAEEARRLEEEQNVGFMGFLRRLAASLGVPLPVLIGGFLILLLLLLLIIILLVQIFKTREVVITDEKETIIRRIAPLSGIILNSPSAILPGIGNENNQVFRVNRSLLGIKVQTMDSLAIAETSPYKKTGTHALKGVINLANGRLVRITVR
jgi:Mg-chelatase subunit ChlD